MSRERFLRLLDAAEYLADHIHEVRCGSSAASKAAPDPHLGLIDLASHSDHAARSTSAGPVIFSTPPRLCQGYDFTLLWFRQFKVSRTPDRRYVKNASLVAQPVQGQQVTRGSTRFS